MNELLQKLPNWAIIIFVGFTLLTSADAADFINVLGAKEESYRALYKQELRDHAFTRKDLNRLKADLSVLNGEIITIPDPFWIKDKQSYLIYLNEAYEESILTPMGLTAQDVIGTRGEPMGVPLEAFFENDARVLKAGHMIRVREQVGDRWGTSTKFPIYRSGQILAIGGYWIEDQQVMK